MELSKVFEFMYCSCIHESAWATMSIHRTREGAESAMNAHKEKAKADYESDMEGYEPIHPFDFAKDWMVSETILLD